MAIEQLMGWLLSGPCCAESPGTRLAHLPLQQQHGLVMAIAAWLGDQQQRQREAPPVLGTSTAQLLWHLARSQQPGCSGVAAAARLVLSALAPAPPSGPSGGSWLSADRAPAYAGQQPGDTAPMPPWLQRQSLLLAEATGSWGLAQGRAAEEAEEADAPGDVGAQQAPSSPKRGSCYTIEMEGLTTLRS